MTHEDSGHYALKHGQDSKLDPVIAEAVKEKSPDGSITCSAAHDISKRLNIMPLKVGKTADLLEVRLKKCQLGLFGYTPQKKIVKPAGNISSQITQAIMNSVENNRISCFVCWKIAEEFGCKKMDISAACEKLELKISPCQLGAF